MSPPDQSRDWIGISPWIYEANILGTDGDQVSSILGGSDPVIAGAAGGGDDVAKETAQQINMVPKEEAQPVSGTSNTAVTDASLHSGDVASATNAPPGAEIDHDTKTRLAISQIPTDKHRESTFAKTYFEFPFTLDAHKEFLKTFQDRWGYGCLRHDYFSATRKIAIRMGTTLHTDFTWYVTDFVAKNLRVRQMHPEILIADFADKIKQRTDAPVDFADNGSWHSPDGAFAHVDSYYPGVVFEVSYSKDKMDLQELAHAYIQGSDGEIQVVVAFEIEHPAAKQARFFVWKKKEVLLGEIEAELVQAGEFRKADGTLNKDCNGISLSLRDFCPDRMIPEDVKPLLNAPTYLGHYTDVYIPALELYRSVDIATRAHQLAETFLQYPS